METLSQHLPSPLSNDSESQVAENTLKISSRHVAVEGFVLKSWHSQVSEWGGSTGGIAPGLRTSSAREGVEPRRTV